MRGPKFPLTKELVETIQWWIDTIPVTRPRSIHLRPACPLTIYTDADGAGHIAAVVFDRNPHPSSMCHTHCPEWLLGPDLKAGIFEFELLAVVLAIAIAVSLFRDALS